MSKWFVVDSFIASKLEELDYKGSFTEFQIIQFYSEFSPYIHKERAIKGEFL